MQATFTHSSQSSLAMASGQERGAVGKGGLRGGVFSTGRGSGPGPLLPGAGRPEFSRGFYGQYQLTGGEERRHLGVLSQWPHSLAGSAPSLMFRLRCHLLLGASQTPCPPVPPTVVQSLLTGPLPGVPFPPIWEVCQDHQGSGALGAGVGCGAQTGQARG